VQFSRRSACISLIAFAALGGTATPALSQMKLDTAVFHPESAAWTVPFKWWIDEVDKATQGRVKFVPHYAGSLISTNETFRALRDGAVPAGVPTIAALTGQVPSMAYLEAIGSMPNEPARVVEAVTALRPVLEEQFRRLGVEYLWSQNASELGAVCRQVHMKTAKDWKNRKVRGAGRWQGEQMRAIGASPVATDPSEQYLALQNRTIDCVLSVAIFASSLKLHEVAPKITMLGTSVNLVPMMVNKGVFDKISAADRAAIKRLSIEAEKRSAEHLGRVAEDAIVLMKSQKADIYRLNERERAEFRKGIMPAFAQMDKEGGAAGKQIADIVKRYW
jgi:C4-dicarboxylate-binding protein DctP